MKGKLTIGKVKSSCLLQCLVFNHHMLSIEGKGQGKS